VQQRWDDVDRFDHRVHDRGPVDVTGGSDDDHTGLSAAGVLLAAAVLR
jgi:hypothetical protein